MKVAAAFELHCQDMIGSFSTGSFECLKKHWECASKLNVFQLVICLDKSQEMSKTHREKIKMAKNQWKMLLVNSKVIEQGKITQRPHLEQAKGSA